MIIILEARCTGATHVRARPTPRAGAALEIDWQVAPTRGSDNADRGSLLLRPYRRRIGGRECLRCRDDAVYINYNILITQHTLPINTVTALPKRLSAKKRKI